MFTENQSENQKITTNLFAIINAIEEELGSDEKELIPSIIRHMIDTGKIKLTCETQRCRAMQN